jgi:hypothetical protein
MRLKMLEEENANQKISIQNLKLENQDLRDRIVTGSKEYTKLLHRYMNLKKK